MTAEHWIRVCWVILVVYWTINAWRVKPTRESQSWLGFISDRIPVWVGGYLLFRRHLPYPLSIMVISHSLLAIRVGTGICTVGLLGAIWSRKTLADNWSNIVTFKRGHEMVERGPYRFVRHPIYTSILIMGGGTAIAFGRLGAFVGVISEFLGFWLKLRQEEKLLIKHFPVEYAAYRARVKALLPYVF